MKVSGYVQAGGGSTRFGGDKALSRLGAKTMLARTVELVTAACGSARIVAALGKYAGASTTLVEDRWPGEGPLGGILTALYESQSGPTKVEWNLIVSCDMPFLAARWLAFLCERASLSAAQVVVPQSAGGLEPLCACWRTDSVTVVQAAFDSGVRKVTEAMKHLRMEVLDESVWKRFDTDGRLFWNMNTPADYDEARRIFESRER